MITEPIKPSTPQRRGMNASLVTLIVAATFITTLCAIPWYRNNFIPINRPTAHIPNAAQYGDPEGAIRQSEKLLAALRAANWDWSAVPRDLKQLPGRKYAENEIYRTAKNISSFVKPIHPESGDLAFYTEIYVRSNTEQYPGERTKTKPSGFYIVAFKDGHIKTVPVEQARMKVIAARGGAVMTFPGMQSYDPDGIKAPDVEFANGGKPTAQQTAFLKAARGKDDCKGCSL